MGELKFQPRTLDDELIKDGLCAVGALEDQTQSRGMNFVVGGIAAQSYLPTAYRRPTSDIDLAVLRSLNFEDFKEFSLPAVEWLRDNGYTVEEKKGHLAFQVIYSTASDELAVIEFPRRNEHNYHGRAERLKREMQHTRRKILEDRGATYRVASPEDIAVPKIVRGVGSLNRNPEFCSFIESGKPIALTDKRLDSESKKIQDLRYEAMLHVGDLRLAERLRFISDIFDIRALSEVAGFNENYLRQVIDSWNVLKGRTAERELLVNYLLPDMGN